MTTWPRQNVVAKSDSTIVGDNLLNAQSEGDYVIIFCCLLDVLEVDMQYCQHNCYGCHFCTFNS